MRPILHELPKSMILSPVRLGFLRRIFSGLRSQWMMPMRGEDKNTSACAIC